MSKFKMKGVVPPMVTPFKENGEVDFDGLKTLVTFLKDRVDGLFITGSYGGCALMNSDERKMVVETTMKTVAGKIPIVVHVGTADSYSAADLTRHAKSMGASAVSAVGPFYYKHNPDQLCEYYSHILKAADGLPVYVYNNPGFQGYLMDIPTLKRLKDMGISGIKDATFDILAHADYVRKLKDDNFEIALGTEALWLEACVLGCQAFIPGLANAFPEICAKLYQEGMARDYDACLKTQLEVNEMRDIMYLARSTQLAVYAMLEIRGVVKAYPRSPFIPASDKEKQSITTRLKELKLI